MVLQVILGALMMGSIYGLLALGYSLIYKASGLMTFVQGDFYMLGAFFGLTLYGYLKLPFALALIITMAIMFVIGVIIERFVIRILKNKKASGIYVVLSTIGLSIIFQNAAMLLWGSSIFQFPAVFKSSGIKIGTANIAPETLLVVIVAVTCMCALHFFMTKTKYGTSMRAAAQDPMAASSMGINVPSTIAITWGLSAALAGVAGILIGPVFGVTFTMGVTNGLKGFAGAVLGGYGDMYGAIVGSSILGLVETFAAGYVSSIYKDLIAFVILILAITIKPTGIFNAKVYDD